MTSSEFDSSLETFAAMYIFLHGEPWRIASKVLWDFKFVSYYFLRSSSKN